MFVSVFPSVYRFGAVMCVGGLKELLLDSVAGRTHRHECILNDQLSHHTSCSLLEYITRAVESPTIQFQELALPQRTHGSARPMKTKGFLH